MIYALYGTDVKKVHSRASNLVDSLLAKKPDATHMRITPDRFSPGVIEEVLGAQGLFSDKLIVELDALIDTPDTGILDSLEDFKTSENIFILIEEEIEAKALKLIEVHAKKIESHDLPEKTEKPPTFFALADALGARNKKNMWVEYQAALMGGAVDEEIHGMLFWQVKSMILAASCSEKDSGLKPFVYGKSKRFSFNYSEKELKALSVSLVTMYHEARRGGPVLGSAMEKWMLSL